MKYLIFLRLGNLTEHKYSVFEQKMFYYKFNLLNKTNPSLVW